MRFEKISLSLLQKGFKLKTYHHHWNCVFFWFQLLTCINPNIIFTLKTPDQGDKKYNGVAVALSLFLAKLSNYGLDTLAPQDRIKQEIKNHGLGVITKAKQVFNVNEDGTSISRSKEAKDTTVFRNCVFIKRSAFGPEAHVIITCYFFLIYVVSAYGKINANCLPTDVTQVTF